MSPLARVACLAALALACRARAAPRPPPPPPPLAPAAPAHRVVLVTLDGVRWQDFFGTPDAARCAHAAAPGCGDTTRPIFARLRGELAARALVWGAPEAATEAAVANRAYLSLPGYQSIFAGEVTPCEDNACARVGVETFPERVARELRLPGVAVASFASWERMRAAVARAPGAVVVNAGFDAVRDPTAATPAQRAELDALNARQRADRPPWGAARGDAWTLLHARRHLREHRPRFLHVGLNDADEWAHRGDYGNYLATLRRDDDVVADLRAALDAVDRDGARTTLLVTTDHGRGDGARWTDHGPDTPEARRIWLVALPPAGRRPGAVRTRAVTHLDLRPTIEALLGLAPRACEGCGQAIPEVVEAGTGP